jgi:hypothetical protein
MFYIINEMFTYKLIIDGYNDISMVIYDILILIIFRYTRGSIKKSNGPLSVVFVILYGE